MFSFNCARCGHRELVHLDEEEFNENYETGLWPDEEYQESPLHEELEETERGTLKKKGYSHTLKECPEFTYRKRDETEVVKVFSKNEKHIEYAPEHLRRKIRRLISVR